MAEAAQQNWSPGSSREVGVVEETPPEARISVSEKEELPEVFALQPLSRRRVTVRVRRRGPARFYFVDED